MSTHRTPDDRLAQIEALAQDPDADWDTLHFIAENYPSLRPAVAANPGTYPELLEALGAMNDPEIDAALASRAAASAGTAASGADTSAEPSEEQTGELPPVAEEETAVHEGMAAQGPAFLEQRLDAPEPDQALDSDEEQTQYIPAVTEEPEEAAGAQAAAAAGAEPDSAVQPEYPAAAAPAAAAGYAAQEQAAYAQQVQAASVQPPRERESRAPKVLAAVLLPLVGLIAVAVLIFALLGDSGDQMAEEPAPEQEEPAPQQEEAPDQGEPAEQEEDAAEDEVDLDGARTELTALPDDSTCQNPEEDAAEVAAFVETASDADAMEQEAGMLEDLFEDLQDSCDNIHAAAVYEGVRSGGDEDTAGSFEAVGTDWSDQMMSADGAQEMDGFIAPDENKICLFEDGLTCTVLEQDAGAPEGCEDGATFTMQVDGDTPGLDCDSELSADEDYETLAHDDTATDGFLACVSLEDRISCWNTLTGVGFEMSEGDHYAYSP